MQKLSLQGGLLSRLGRFYYETRMEITTAGGLIIRAILLLNDHCNVDEFEVL